MIREYSVVFGKSTIDITITPRAKSSLEDYLHRPLCRVGSCMSIRCSQYIYIYINFGSLMERCESVCVRKLQHRLLLFGGGGSGSSRRRLT